MKNLKINQSRKLPLYLSLLFVIVLISITDAFASHKIKVLALFTDKAMLVIDGSQKILKKGQTYNGVKLISSDSEFAMLELHGEKKKFKLGTEISTSFKKADPGKELVIWKDMYDMFRIHGSINNFSVHFLVDTGATTVAMSSSTAKRIGLNYKQGTPMQASTASGVTNGYQVKLDNVKVGHIQLYNIEAMILEGGFPTEVLLGQSFLSRIHMTRDGDKMRLRKMF